MQELRMAVSDVDEGERLVIGTAAPYAEVSLLTPDPQGERMMAGVFRRSIAHRADRIPLLIGHRMERIMGTSRRFDDSPTSLVGHFGVNEGDDGDRLLEDLRHGYYSGMSVGFVPLDVGRGSDGVREVRQAKLVEVSLVGVPAYEGAGLIAVRNAQDLGALLAPFQARPVVNLDPIPPIHYG